MISSSPDQTDPDVRGNFTKTNVADNFNRVYHSQSELLYLTKTTLLSCFGQQTIFTYLRQVQPKSIKDILGHVKIVW